eukprot:scaffold17460_cov128-Isochrysis_galbana.AAC.11
MRNDWHTAANPFRSRKSGGSRRRSGPFIAATPAVLASGELRVNTASAVLAPCTTKIGSSAVGPPDIFHDLCKAV